MCTVLMLQLEKSIVISTSPDLERGTLLVHRNSVSSVRKNNVTFFLNFHAGLDLCDHLFDNEMKIITIYAYVHHGLKLSQLFSGGL